MLSPVRTHCLSDKTNCFGVSRYSIRHLTKILTSGRTGALHAFVAVVCCILEFGTA